MCTKSHFSAVERYLSVQPEVCNGTGIASEQAACEVRLTKARKEFEAAHAAVSQSGIHRIIAAVDHAHHPAVEAAINIAQPLAARIAIVHVLEPLPASNLEMAYDLTPACEESRTAAKAELVKFQAEVPPNLLLFTTLREGHAAEQIVAAAQEFNADLIVIGTHRRGMVATFLLGSTSQAVLRQAHCPVVFVTESCAVHEEARELQHV